MEGKDGGGEDPRDWLFDYFMTVFKSPQWDAEIMGFIDDNCLCFDNDEVRWVLHPCTRTFFSSELRWGWIGRPAADE